MGQAKTDNANATIGLDVLAWHASMNPLRPLLGMVLAIAARTCAAECGCMPAGGGTAIYWTGSCSGTEMAAHGCAGWASSRDAAAGSSTPAQPLEQFQQILMQTFQGAANATSAQARRTAANARATDADQQAQARQAEQSLAGETEQTIQAEHERRSRLESGMIALPPRAYPPQEYERDAGRRRKALSRGDCWQGVPLAPPRDGLQRMLVGYLRDRDTWRTQCFARNATSRRRVAKVCTDCLEIFLQENDRCLPSRQALAAMTFKALTAVHGCLLRAHGSYERCADPCAPSTDPSTPLR